MNYIGIYISIATLIALLGLISVVIFLRYRFKGDRTFVFITLFIVIFVADIILTLGMLQPVAQVTVF